MTSEERERYLSAGVFDYENQVVLAEMIKRALAAVIDVSKQIDVSNLETSEAEDKTITATIVLLTELDTRNQAAIKAHRDKFSAVAGGAGSEAAGADSTPTA